MEPAKTRKRRHPEQGDDEAYMGNCDLVGFFHLGWKTKRPGRVPYDSTGKPLRQGDEDYPPDESFDQGWRVPPDMLEALRRDVSQAVGRDIKVGTHFPVFVKHSEIEASSRGAEIKTRFIAGGVW